jgi:hypothetical protein
MNPHPSGMRITKYHSLPSTSTLIVKDGQTVIGTVSLVRQSAFGMPLESIFNLNSLPPASRPAEVSSLAIKNGMRQQRGRILFPLLKFLFHYSTEYFGVTHFVIAVNPKWYDFYESVLLFSRLSRKTVETYDFVNGAPAVGGVLDLRTAQRRYIPLYGKRPEERNLAHFFFDLDCLNMEFPFRKKGVISDPVLSPQLMEHFFRKKTDTFEKLTDFERAYLRQLYNAPEYLSLIPSPNVAPISFRKSKRFDTNLRARFIMDDGKIIQTMIQDVSERGLGGYTALPLPQGKCVVYVDVEDHEPCRLGGELQWQSLEGRFGFAIQEASRSWDDYIRRLDSRLLCDSAAEESLIGRTGTSG